MSDTMHGVTVCKTLTTETAHRLTNYVGKCASIHGHSYKWEVTAALEDHDVQANGISIDFGDLKAAMRYWIYDAYDHALVLDVDDPLLEAVQIEFDAQGQPQKLVRFDGNPTAENFARQAARNMQAAFDKIESGLCYKVLRVRVWETANSYGQWTVDQGL